MHTSPNHVLATRAISTEIAGTLLSQSRRIARQHALNSPSMIAEVRRQVNGPLAELQDLVRVPDGFAGVLIDDVPVLDPAVETPASWQAADGTVPASRVLLTLLAAALGTPFAWEGQQDGRLVTDLVPTRGHDTAQTGASFATELTLHTEDAFHPERASHFMLYGLRNPGGTGTMLASARDALARLSDADRALLTDPGAPILPDSSYEDATDAAPAGPMTAVWNRPNGYGLRFDPAYTELDRATPEWRAAYGRLSDALREVTHEIPVLPGQVLVVDNDACVHGRVPFTPRHDGTDRWLLRVNVARPDAGRPTAEESETGYGQRRSTPFEQEVAA